MTTINTTDDLIRLLRENPEFLAAARRELLTEELLNLPQRFSQYALATDKRLDGIDHNLNDLKEGQLRLQSDVKDLQSDVKDLQSDVKDLQGDVKDLQQGQLRLEGGVHRLENHVNALRGDNLETKMPTRLLGMLRAELDIRRLQMFWMARHDTPPMSRRSHFIQSIDDAADSGVITDEEEIRLLATDMVLRARRVADGSHLWIAAEASGVIDQDDVERARQSALALQKIHGEAAVPVVYGYSISEQQRQQAAPTPELQEVHIFLEPNQS